MVDPDHREDGFYWISIDGQEVEVAHWQAEWGQWLVAGSGTPLSDDLAARVVVPPPASPATRRLFDTVPARMNSGSAEHLR
jgi:hypothetical protein